MTVDASWTAQMDQMVAGARDMAKAAAAFYRSLLDEGIEQEAAMPLTMGWVSAVLSMPRQEPDEQ